MNWFKVKVVEGDDDYTWSGSSSHSLEELLEQIGRGQFIRLENLFYLDRGEVKEWNDWDKREKPSVALNPKYILAVMQYKADPKTISK
jgi:hypothetical protein